MNKTTNYQLSQYEPTDRILHTDFNADNSKIDAALKANADAAAALQTAVAGAGNCKIVYQTYKGKGSGACSFTFAHKPLFVAVFGDGYYFFALQGAAKATTRNTSTGKGTSTVTWSGKSVSWKGLDSEMEYQCNSEGGTYHLIALLDVTQ